MNVEIVSDVEESSEATEATTESVSESYDSDTELCEEDEAYEATDELYDEANASELDSELVESGVEGSGLSEKNEMEDIKTTDDADISEAEKQKIRSEINEKSEYSTEVNDNISSVEELEIYQEANLREEVVDGRSCLVRDDIDLDYRDPKTNKTNRELMQMGRVPYDAKTGERIELHHIGQDYDSPLAELTEDSEHGEYYSVLHTKKGESWRNDSRKNNNYNNVQRPNHWRNRIK